MKTDRNGYAPSIIQEDDWHCYLCGRVAPKLDRHEIFQGSNRQKSKADGLWVYLCHVPCHQGKGGVHDNRAIRNTLSAIAQQRAMEEYGWTTEQFIARYGKNWL